MRRDKYEDERSSGGNGGSSWISYSDMMASLLLVFLLMLCVSLLKYFTMPKEEELQQRQSIEEQLKEIEMREADLAEREEKLAKALAELEKKRAELETAQEQLAKEQTELQATKEQMAKDQAELQKAQEQLEKDQAALQTEQEQLAKDQEELQAAKEQLAKDQAALQTEQEQLQKDQQALEKEKEELEEERASLETEQAQLKKEQAELTKGQDQLRLEQEAFRAEKEAEATPAPEPESEWAREVQREIEKLQAILDQYSLRSRIITSQYSAFENSGLNIIINQDTGDITTPNFILFDAGSSELSNEGKRFLDAFIPLYLEVLMRPEYESDISEVIIEGHTDSYFSTCVELSMQRASRVMAYSMQIPTLTEAQRTYLTERATFIGRGFTDPVFDKDGQINWEASRRVEIKFQIRDNPLLAETELVGELINRLNEAKIPASMNPETGRILPDGILFFETGEDTLTKEGKMFIREFLSVYLDVLMEPRYQNQVGMLIIEGTADRLLPDADRLELSQRRATHVMEYCMQLDLTAVQLAYLQKTLVTAGRTIADSADGTDERTEGNAGEQVTFRFHLKNTDSLSELRTLLQDN